MGNSTNKNECSKDRKITRRDFLKNAGFITGGVALTSIAMASGCTNDDVPPATTPQPTTPAPTTPAPTTTPGTTTPPPTTTPGNGEFVYVSPTSNPDLVDVEGCTSKVAVDRLYSFEHVWVKLLDNNLAVVGITDKMQLLVGQVERGELLLFEPGRQVAFDGFMANLEGQKLNVDIYSPVTATVYQTNDDLYVNSWLIESEPYLGGWLYVLELSNPAELDDLLDPVTYAKLQAADAANYDWGPDGPPTR